MSTTLVAWLAFEGMLMPGEIERLVINGFCFPEDAELSEAVGRVLNIRQAQTRTLCRGGSSGGGDQSYEGSAGCGDGGFGNGAFGQRGTFSCTGAG